MSNNPFSPPLRTDASRDSTTPESKYRIYWRIFSIACIVVALIPIYGYFAHVGRDGQLTVLFLMLAWVITCFNIVVCIARGLLLNGLEKTVFWLLLSATLIVFACFGFNGIRHAILELWA